MLFYKHWITGPVCLPKGPSFDSASPVFMLAVNDIQDFQSPSAVTLLIQGNGALDNMEIDQPLVNDAI